MKKIITIAALGASALALAACAESKQEEALEAQADDIREAGEQTADQMEGRADTLDQTVDGVDSKAEQNLENKADAVRDTTEAKADALEEKADNLPQ